MPSRLVLAVMASPAGVLTTTVAVPTAPPDGSVTWPRMEPDAPVPCAFTSKGRSAASNARAAQRRYFWSGPKIIESPEIPLDEVAASEVHCAAASPPGAPFKLQGVRMDCPLFGEACRMGSTPASNVIAVTPP